MASESNQRLTKNERRQQAREQAQKAREQEKKREKRRRLMLQGGVVVGVLAILVVVGLVIMQSMKPAGPGPRNMASGGAIFGPDLEIIEGPALDEGEARQDPKVDRDRLPLDVSVYVDYMCPGCGSFEQTYGPVLENYVGAGDVTLRVYPVAFQDSASMGTNYSTRAANLFACLVEQQPEAALATHNALLSAAVQPQQGTPGLDDDELLDVAEQSGAELTDELRSCVTDRQFGDFIASNTQAVSETGLVGLAEGTQLLDSEGQLQPADGPQRLVQTPTVIVNGVQWVQQVDGEFEQYLLKIKQEVEKNAPADDAAAADGGDADGARENDDAEEEAASE